MVVYLIRNNKLPPYKDLYPFLITNPQYYYYAYLINQLTNQLPDSYRD